MPQTTTAFAARNAGVWLQDENDDWVDISGSSNKVDTNFMNKVGEIDTFGSYWVVRTVGGKDAEVTLDIVCSTETNEAYQLVKEWYFGGDNSPRGLRIDTPSTEVGNDRYEGSYILESASLPLDSSDANPVKMSLKLKSSGAVTLDEITS